MLRSLAFVCLFAANLTTFAARADEPAAGKQVAQSATLTVDRNGETAKVEMRYWLFLPQSYGNQDGKFPLMLFLHGAGERGSDLELVKKHGPPMLVAGQSDFRFVLVSPQRPKDTRWDAAELAKLVEHVANTFRVDRQRMYVTGLSMGAAARGACWPSIPACSPPACRFAAGVTLTRPPPWPKRRCGL